MPQPQDAANPVKDDALAEAAARARQTADDFAAVFGVAGKRSEQQTRVLEYLRTFTGDSSNAFQFAAGGDGIAQIAAGIHRDGAQSNFRIIERQCSIAQRNKTEPPKTAVKVKK